MDFLKHYEQARKLGLRQYRSNIVNGRQGYLASLDGLLKNVDIISEEDLGSVEIPLHKIIGTNSSSRGTVFASNFMPLLNAATEFGQKWMNVCEAHLNEGLREPIKAYEYMNWFYIIEGNKRVSVLKYFDVYSYTGQVTRLVPKRDEQDPDTRLYYRYMEFYNKTGINSIWFSMEDSFHEFYELIKEYRPKMLLSSNRYNAFVRSVYLPFRKAYHKRGGGQLPITTGDALLEYIKLYGIPGNNFEKKLDGFLQELQYFSKSDRIQVSTKPEGKEKSSFLTGITSMITPKRKVRAAFVYSGSIANSNWTYSHEIGRLHIKKVLKEQVLTSYVENVHEGIDAYNAIKKLAEEGNDIIFATSPAFINATLKAALEYKDVRFFNCSETHSFKHVSTYSGRIYEARFLAGIAAGINTTSDILGYVASYPLPGIINSINAFALGARLVNPRARVFVEWTENWAAAEDKSIDNGNKLIDAGADIICHQNTVASGEISKEFGVYSVVCAVDGGRCVPDKYIASPVWNWGIFYEKIIKGILNDVLKPVAGMFEPKPLNFWWGLDSGVVDFFFSTNRMAGETAKLIGFMKRMIASYEYHPFTGPVFDQDGVLRIKHGEVAVMSEILKMDWFVEGIDTRLQPVDRDEFIDRMHMGMI